ncbi:transporter substrate-binding domain-containing protein [Alginatibacterium sediminis]|nr:transporter substrate-binding domain-containing protein [Alginatibacterium sediminis]
MTPIIRLIFMLLITLMLLQKVVANDLSLTEKEQQWIDNEGEINLSVAEYGWSPFAFVSKGEPAGYLVEYIDVVAKIAGVKVNWNVVNSRFEVLKAVADETDDMISHAAKVEYYEKDFDFGDVIVPRVINAYTRKASILELNSFDDLKGMKIASPRAYQVTNLLKKNYPDLIIIDCENIEDGLSKVSSGEADILFADNAVASHAIHSALLTNIKILPTFNDINQYFKPVHIIYSKKSPKELMTVFEKARAKLDIETVRTLQQKWLLNRPVVQSIKLTKEEQNWLNDAPVIRTQNLPDFPPFDFTEKGKPSGYSVDLLLLLGQKTGLTFEFIQGKSWSEYKQLVEDRSIDILHLASKSPDRERYLDYTSSYFTGSPNLLYGKSSHDYINDSSQVEDKVIAVIRDSIEQRFLSQKHPELNLLSIDSTRQGLNAVLRGDADYFLCYPSVCDTYIVQHFLSRVEPRGYLGIKGIEKNKQAYIAVRSDWPELTSILNKAILSVTPSEEKELKEKWFDNIRSDKLAIETLTEEEENWLVNNSRLTFSSPKAAPPYAFLDEKGEMGGLGSDLTEMFGQEYGIDSIYIKYPTWRETYQALVVGEIDFLPLISVSEERKKEILYSDPVMHINHAIFSNTRAPYFNNISELKGFRVGIIKGSTLGNTLRRDHPYLDFVTYNSTDDVLRALSEGQIDALIDNPHIVNYKLNTLGLKNVSPSAETDYSFEIAYAIHPSKPELVTLFNKFIHRFDRSKLELLMQKWNNVKVVNRTDWKQAVLWSILFALILILFASLILAQNRKKTVKVLALNGKHLRNAQRVANVGSWELDAKGQISQISEQAGIILGLAPNIVLSHADYQTMINIDDLASSKECWQAALKTGLYSHEHRIIVNNKEKWISEIAELSFDPEGNFKRAAGIIQDITEQKIAELQVIQNEQELRELTAKLLNVQEEERRRVARELHDDLSQRLAVLSINVGTLEIDESFKTVKQKLSDVKQGIISVATDIHGLSRRLHPSILDDLGLVDALKSEITSYVDREMIAVNFSASSQQINVDKDSALSIFRITQESLRNIAKYSEASKVQVSLSIINQQLILQIVDDGIGFDVQQAMKSPGLGLQSMTERARLIGAKLNIESDSTGTTVEIQLPIEE